MGHFRQVLWSITQALALKDFNLKGTEFTNNNFFLGSFVCLWEADLLGIQNAYFIRGVQSVVNIILDFEV